MKQLLLLLTLFSSTTFAYERDMPPGFIKEKSCKNSGPVKICAFNQSEGHPQLRIEYLRSRESVSVWIKLNGREGFFPLRDNSVLLNDFRNVSKCVLTRGTQKLPLDSYPACPKGFKPASSPRNGLVWFFESPKEEEAELFFYARDQYGRANIWDIELAFVDRFGNWDSKQGRNYQFSFRP